MTEVCAFGDSVLKGVVIENDKYKVSKNRFSNICEKILNIEISNKGKFGSTIKNGEKIIENNIELIKNKNTEYVILEFGGNDCDYNWKEISDNPNGKHMPNINIQDFINKYSMLIEIIKKYKKKAVLLSLPPIDSKKYFEKISKGLKKENILKWMNENIEFIGNWHERYNLEVFKLAINNKIPIIDITSKFLEKKDYSSFLCEDGIHPNEKGHKVIAEAICEHLQQKNIKFA